MRAVRKCFGALLRRCFIGLLLAALCAGALPAAAQLLPGYGDLTGTAPAASPAADAPAPGSEAPAASPDLEAYGKIESVTAGALIDTSLKQMDVFQQRLGRILGAVPGSWEAVLSAMSRASPDAEPTFFVGVAIFVAILLIIGRGGAMIFAAYVGRPIMVGMQKPHPVGMTEKLPVLAARVGITAAAVIITLLITGGLGALFFDQHPPTLRTAVTIIGAYTAMIMVDTIWRMVISPYLPNYRVPAISDAAAVRLYRGVSLATTVVVISIAVTVWLELMEVHGETVAFMRIVMTGIAAIVMVIVVLRNHAAISSAILGGLARHESTWVSALASRLWAPLLLVYIVGGWFVASFRLIMGLDAGGGPAAAFAVFLVAVVVYAVTIFIVERLFARARLVRELNRRAEEARRIETERQEYRSAAATVPVEQYEGSAGDLDGDDDEESAGPVPGSIPPRAPGLPGGEDEEFLPVTRAEPPLVAGRGMKTFEDLARRIASLFAIGVAAWMSLTIWVGGDVFEEGSTARTALEVLQTAFLGYILYHGLRIWMDRRISEEGVGEVSLVPGDEGGAASAASRLGTLLPLIRTAVLLIVAVSVSLILAAQLGVNVAPLFAGAGIVGLAIGFGSQALVRDILSGMFFLLDDAFRKGEYIDVGEVKGTVEKISLRSFQLRHHLGALNTIPFGEIKHLTNYSRDWVMMKLPLRLTYDTDVEKLRKVIKKLGEELLKHPLEGPKFVQALKSQGVYMMEDSAMIVRVKYMTRPGDQWTTRKLVYQRIREVFAAEGIKFAHREVTVRIPDMDRGRELAPVELQAVGAAARRALDLVDEQALLPRAVGDDR